MGLGLDRSTINGDAPVSRPWGVHTIDDIYTYGVHAQMPDGSYAVAVALPYDGNRLKAAWWILTGRAYALQWPKPGELEDAIKLPFWNRSRADVGSPTAVEK
jgi:hypothetical protein